MAENGSLRIYARSAAYRHTTVSGHMPKSHQAHLEWTPSRLIHWAEGVGVATAEVVRTILERKPHPEMGYRACLGILSLEKMYSKPQTGSRQPARRPTPSLLLSESEIDSEALAGPSTGARSRNRFARPSP
jgi:hypothetical protein